MTASAGRSSSRKSALVASPELQLSVLQLEEIKVKADLSKYRMAYTVMSKVMVRFRESILSS